MHTTFQLYLRSFGMALSFHLRDESKPCLHHISYTEAAAEIYLA